MKILNTSVISLENAVILSSMASPRQLARVSLDQYALIMYEHKKPLWAFESKLFSTLLDSLCESIVDLDIYFSEESEMSEFRLQLESGRQISIKNDGDFYEVSKLSFSGFEDASVVPAHERWELDSVFPLDRMLVTHAFAYYLDMIHDGVAISDVLNRIWYDYSELDSYCGKKTLDRQSFPSEFGELTAVELQCGRVVFFATAYEPEEEIEECF